MSSTSSPSTTIIIGLSGPSSSGKTTLARLLRQIFNISTSTSDDGSTSGGMKLFILHEDDFYKTDKDIPLKHITSPPSSFGSRTLQDWDCIESLDLPLLSSTLHHIKTHGSLPPSMFSKEDQNTVGDSGVDDETVGQFHREMKEWVSSLKLPTSSSTTTEGPAITICLLDGFLLYPDPHSPPGSLKTTLHTLLSTLLTSKLFIPSTRSQTIQRRNARKGYVTMEGFWEDPEGYVEDVVWPNFGSDHGWLFGWKDGRGGESRESGSEEMGKEVWKAIDEGRVDEGVAKENGIAVGPGSGEVHLREILPWAVERLREAVEGKV